jgi:ABC-type antimicrobial peptide transport system permease subunit
MVLLSGSSMAKFKCICERVKWIAPQPTVMPGTAVVGGVGVATAVGVLVGIYPATRAAGLAPAGAFRTT